MEEEQRMWVVRAGEGAAFFDEFKNKNVVALGWNEVGDVSNVKGPEEIKKLFREKYPNYSNGKLGISAGQLSRFKFELNPGNYVVTYDPEKREYLVGKISSGYEWNPALLEYRHIHKVEWLGTVPRDNLSIPTKNTLGAISTLFEVGSDAKKDILEVLEGKPPVEAQEPETSKEELRVIREDFSSQAREFIKDKVSRLDWDEMQELVAGVLRALGYKTIVSPKGADRGKDILASPDGLGLEDPKIIVEVKHRSGQMGRSDITRFTGGLRKGSKGLYVSTGGFTKDAKYEAERSEVPLTLIDLDLLVELVISNYDKFDPEAKDLLPLTKIYWPE